MCIKDSSGSKKMMSFIEFFVMDQPNTDIGIHTLVNENDDEKIDKIEESNQNNDDNNENNKIIQLNPSTLSTDNNYDNSVRCNLSQFFVRSMHEIISEKFIKKDLKQTKQFIYRQKHFSPSPSSKWCIDHDGQIEKVSQWIKSMPKILPNDNGIVMEKKVKFHEKITVEPKISKIKSISHITINNNNNNNNINDNDEHYNDDGGDESSIQLDESVYKILEKIFHTTTTTIVHNDNNDDHSDCLSLSSNSTSSSISAPTTLPQVIPSSTTTTTTKDDLKKQTTSSSSFQENSNKLMKKIITVCKHPALIRGHHHFSCSSCRERNISCQCLDIQTSDDHDYNAKDNNNKNLRKKLSFNNKYYGGYYHHHHQYYHYNMAQTMNPYQQQQQPHYYYRHQHRHYPKKHILRRTQSYFSFNTNEFLVTKTMMDNGNAVDENQLDSNQQKNKMIK
ncbi:uncharacterized protein LOC113789853 isoform X2 [Dermatophagoides pteronyssinus]|uniref:uncharacterized protein LOC113789853 isoform X2 n=1 Tax=Dermatophagoides pteronyssinus TaxID=6956 RepID=UPI003F663BCA